MAKSWPLNDMEITSEGRDLRRKALTAEHGLKNKRAMIEKLCSKDYSEHFGIRKESSEDRCENCDSEDIIHLGEGMTSEQFGYFERGTRAEQRAVEDLIITNAKKYGLYIEPSQTKKYGDRKQKRSGESVVYLNENERKVYKVKAPYAKLPLKGHGASDVLYENEVHNLLFPNARYILEGVTEGLDGPRFVLSQQYIENSFEPATQDQIDHFLEKEMGLTKEDRYTYGNDYFAVIDVSADSDNVLIGTNGELYFIDPLIRFKKPGKEVLLYCRTNS